LIIVFQKCTNGFLYFCIISKTRHARYARYGELTFLCHWFSSTSSFSVPKPPYLAMASSDPLKAGL